MNPERWQQVDRLFQAALERPPEDRAAFLDAVCQGDLALRREVELLLAYDEQAGSFIQAPALEVAAKALAADQAESLVGQHIGHYEVLSLLGAGGMGEVYLAQDARLGRKVALKLLPRCFTRDAQRVQRFRQEARAASALNHPNLLTIHDVGELEGRQFITTEYVEGETLRRRLAGRQMDLREALEVATQIAGALAAAHGAGIAHRDIKPENVMVRPDGIVKVLDFGLAKLTERLAGVETEAPTLAQVNTDPGVRMGTVKYMSPEQARGAAVDVRTDIFSLVLLRQIDVLQ